MRISDFELSNHSSITWHKSCRRHQWQLMSHKCTVWMQVQHIVILKNLVVQLEAEALVEVDSVHGRFQCTYCGKQGHLEDKCWDKNLVMKPEIFSQTRCRKLNTGRGVGASHVPSGVGQIVKS